MTQPPWRALVVCPVPDCRGRLRRQALAGSQYMLQCQGCRALYPVLAGVPILVPDPPTYLARHRDAVLAALAEVGAADEAAVATVTAMATAGPRIRPEPFSDDWVDSELGGGPRPRPQLDDRPAHRALATLQEAADPGAFAASLADRLPTRRAGAVVEIGCGASPVSAWLHPAPARQVVADISLRAVLAAQRALGATDVGVVVDAEALPFVPGKAGAVIAPNLVDLLDDPLSFLRTAGEMLNRSGRLILSVPDPSLGPGDTDAGPLLDVLDAAGLEVIDFEDGVPWLRPHHARHFELHLVAVAVARRLPPSTQPS